LEESSKLEAFNDFFATMVWMRRNARASMYHRIMQGVMHFTLAGAGIPYTNASFDYRKIFHFLILLANVFTLSVFNPLQQFNKHVLHLKRQTLIIQTSLALLV
jgi:hypothetical protein